MPRSSITTSPITSSATLRVLEKGALKTGMPRRAGGVEVHLVGADAEAPHGDQPVGRRQGLAAQLGAGADAEHVDALQRLAQRRAVQRLASGG